MHYSEKDTRKTGFSTGALERGNFQIAAEWMREQKIRTIELSALRYDELRPMIEKLDLLDFDEFDYVSIHAPSSFPAEKEAEVVNLLLTVCRRGWNIIVHPDVIKQPELWEIFGSQLLIENMDRRKPIGRTAAELGEIFNLLPNARLCLDVAHARQLDTSLTELREILENFAEKIAEIHISELNSYCCHCPLSNSSIQDFRSVASMIKTEAPVIIESMFNADQYGLRIEEIQLAERALPKYN
jgi:hypothetical protein